MKSALLLIISTMILIACEVNQHYVTDRPYAPNDYSTAPSRAEAGKCYARCRVPHELIMSQEEYIVFTGDPKNTDVAIEWIDIKLQPASTKWVKKKADKNCLSADPDDCLVWCLIDVPAQRVQFYTVRDTSHTDEYEVRRVVINQNDPKNPKTEWREIMCENQLNDVIEPLMDRLYDLGFYEPSTTAQGNDQHLREALVLYQRDRDLAVGGVTIETLDALGIDY